MGNPTFLDGALYPFRYYSESVPANTSTQITSTLRTELTALSWTEPVANTFRSPANSLGQYMDLVVTEPAANTWQMVLNDSLGFTVCTRRIDISASVVTTVEYYTGNAHVLIDANYLGGRQIYAFLLDCFPDEGRYYDHPVVGNGSLSGAGTFDNLGYLAYCNAIDNVAGANVQRLSAINTMNGTLYTPRMASGRYLYTAVWASQNIRGTICWSGKFPQALVGPTTPASGTEWVIPIDYATSATFRATSLTNSASPSVRLFMRKA
jgi:hypothetical protein